MPGLLQHDANDCLQLSFAWGSAPRRLLTAQACLCQPLRNPDYTTALQVSVPGCSEHALVNTPANLCQGIFSIACGACRSPWGCCQ